MTDHSHGVRGPQRDEPTGRQQIVAFLAALAFGAIATSGLAEQRVDHKSSIGIWLGAATMAAAVPLLLSTRKALAMLAESSRVWTKLHSAHVLGATAGVMAVHAVLALKVLPRDNALVECPAQLVNDAVLVGCVVVLLWAVVARTRRARIVWFAVALLPCLAYLRTAMYWHCDHVAGHPVQDYVASQLTAAFDAAVAFLAYIALGRRTV